MIVDSSNSTALWDADGGMATKVDWQIQGSQSRFARIRMGLR